MKQLSLLEFDRLRQPMAHGVAALADDIIEELGLEPPVDPRIVASYLGIARIEPTELDVSGCLVCGDQGVLIKVRASDNPRRQRFTIFHECSHTFFSGFERVTQYRCEPDARPGQNAALEALCDEGASGLLFPRRHFLDDLEDADFGIGTVMALAERYEASLEATAHRVVDLSSDAPLFVVLARARKPADRSDPSAVPRLRVQVARGRAGAWPYVPRHKSVTEDSPLHRALMGEVVQERTTLDELTRSSTGEVEVSARLVPYRGSKRVLAMYRKLSQPTGER